MLDWRSQGNEKKDAEENGSPFSAHSISLPKGGRAIRGISEKLLASRFPFYRLRRLDRV